MKNIQSKYDKLYNYTAKKLLHFYRFAYVMKTRLRLLQHPERHLVS